MEFRFVIAEILRHMKMDLWVNDETKQVSLAPWRMSEGEMLT